MTPPEASQRADQRIAALDRLGDAVLALAEESRQDRLARNRRDRLHLVLLIVVTLMIGGLGTLGWQNRRLNSGNAQILQAVRDCTTAGGRCYENSEARSGQYIQQLVAAQFDIAWCVKVSATKTDAQKCVADAQRGR